MSDDPIVGFEEHGPITVGCVQSASVLDAMNVAQFGKEVQEHIRQRQGINLLLDFEKVEYLSSAVLTELLRIKRTIVEVQGTLRLCALNKEILKVFEITNLDRIFTIYENVGTALSRYERSIQVAEQEEAWERQHEDT